jgi:O-antigen ligase
VTNETPTGFCRTGLLTDVPCGAGDAGTLIRAVGTFANPNLLAAFLVLLAPFALLASAAVAERSAWVVVAVVSVIGYGAVITTFSRSGYVAALVGVLLLGAAYRLAPRITRHRQILISAGALAALLVGGVAIWVVSRAGHALGVRDQAWSAAVRIGLAHPFGVGLGQDGSYISALVPGGRQFQHAHDLWLNWLAEGGVLGLVAMVLITVVSLGAAARVARGHSSLGAAGLAALAGFYLVSAVDHPANVDRINMLFWLVLGLVMAERPGRLELPGPLRPLAPGTARRYVRRFLDGTLPGARQPLPDQSSHARWTRSR